MNTIRTIPESLNLRISDELAKFLEMPSGVKMSYNDALQAIQIYFRKNKLHKSHFNIYIIDYKIASLLDLKKNTEMTRTEFIEKNNLFRHFSDSYKEYLREKKEKEEIKEFEERFKIEQEKEEKEKRYQEFKKNKMLEKNKSYEKSNIDKISNQKPFSNLKPYTL
jgi:hypothetical protein